MQNLKISTNLQFSTNPYVAIGGRVFYPLPRDTLFILLLWNHLELWQRLWWLFLNICALTLLVFPIRRLENGQPTKKARQFYVRGYLVSKAHKNKIPTAMPMFSGMIFSMTIIFTLPGVAVTLEKKEVVSVRQRCSHHSDV